MLLSRDDEPERAVEHLVALGLQRVQVVANGEAARRERELVLQQFPVRLGGGLEEHEAVA
jgi:hypothetical protein